MTKPRTSADGTGCRATRVDVDFEYGRTLAREAKLLVRSRNRTRRSCNVHARTHNAINEILHRTQAPQNQRYKRYNAVNRE